VGVLSKFFSLVSVFDFLFSLLDRYSLILKIATAILKILFLFSMSSIDKAYNKKRYTISLDLPFEQWYQAFSAFNILLIT